MEATKAGCDPTAELCLVLGAAVMISSVVKIEQIPKDAMSTRYANGLT
jgi:hypothetical protein